MKRHLFLALGCVLLLTVQARAADGSKSTRDADPPKASKESKEDRAALFARLCQGPSGVCKKEFAKDKKGRINIVYVVGKSRISTALGKNKGIEIAQKRAINDAKGRFLLWLKEEATIHEGQDDETVTVTEGTEESGKEDARRESGKAIEKNTTKFQTVAKGMLRGLQTAYYEQDGDNKNYIVILKWSAKSNAAAAQVEKEIKEAGKETRPGTGTGTGSKPRKGDKNIPNKKGTIDDDD